MVKVDANYFKIRVYAFDLAEVGSWWDFKRHISPFTRIFLIKEGEQRVRFQGEEIWQRAGDLCLVPPYLPVDYYCPDYCAQYYFIFSCQFPSGKDLLTDYTTNYRMPCSDFHETSCERLLEVLPDFGLLSTDARRDDFNQLIFAKSLGELSVEQKLAAQGAVGSLMAPFCQDLQRRAGSLRFAEALQYIESHLAADLSLGVLAELEGLSPTYFSDQFFAYAGVRPTEYIARKRENRAKELLTSTRMPLQEIASAVGLADVAYFSRFFKKRSGSSPLNYRKKHAMTDL